MADRIIELYEANKTTELCDVADEIPFEEIKQNFKSRCLHSSGDPCDLLRAVFKGSPCQQPSGLERHVGMFVFAVELLEDEALHPKTASDLIGVLLMEADTYAAPTLAELATVFIDCIKAGEVKTGKSLELFPKILSCIALCNSVPLQPVSCGTMDGVEYKSQVLNNMCAAKWHGDSVIHLANMFRDIPMSAEELKFVIDKILRILREVDLRELPALVYQLLLLSVKGHKRLVLEGISQFFHDMDQQQKQFAASDRDGVQTVSVDELRHTEGNVILHIVFAIKQDQDRGREFLKYLKTCQLQASERVLVPFNVALALSIAKIQRFEEQILDLLKSAIMTNFKDSDRYRMSKWIQEHVPPPLDVEEQILQTVKNSKCGWDHVGQGMVQLGFLLMDAGSQRHESESVATVWLSPNQRAGRMGAKILLETFKCQDFVRSEIVEQTLNRIVTRATAPSSRYIELLTGAVASCPQFLIDSLSKVRETFDYLSFLPVPTARGLLRAIEPLLKVNLSLRDSLMLVLRKSLFSRQLEARKIAVMGYLLVLEKFKILGTAPPSSQPLSQSLHLSQQVEVDVHCRPDAAANEVLCLEILGNLRRCFSQQCEVRQVLYDGLFSVLRLNSQLGGSILELLYKQFERYFEPDDDVLPPVKLAPCVSGCGSEVILSEPLAHLVSCLQLCVIRCDDQALEEEHSGCDDVEVIEQCRKALTSLTKRILKCELEDFELDKSSDFCHTNSVGMKNTLFAEQLLGIYEALIEFNFLSCGFSIESSEVIVQLFDAHQTLSSLLKEKSTAAGRGRGRPSSSKQPSSPKSHLSLNCSSKLLDALYSDSTPSHQQSLSVLRDNQQFAQHIVSVAVLKVHQIQDCGTCDGAFAMHPSLIFDKCCIMGKNFFKRFTSDFPLREQRDKGKSVVVLCLDGYCLLVNGICARYPEKVVQFLTYSSSNVPPTAVTATPDIQHNLHQHIKKLQKVVVATLSDDEGPFRSREAAMVVSLISTLSQQLQQDSTELHQVLGWCQKMCTEQSIDDHGLVKALMKLHFSLTLQLKSGTSLIRKLAGDIHYHLGDVEEDVEVLEQCNYSIVSPVTASPTVMLPLISHLEHVLDDADWMGNRIKSHVLSGDLFVAENAKATDEWETLENAVCVRLAGAVLALHHLSQSAIVRAVTEPLLKMLTRVYVSLCTAAKYFLALYNRHVGELSGQFEKLVKLTATRLQPQVYSLITYIQSTQGTEPVAAKKGKGKNTPVLRGRALRETKTVPNLIYHIEQYEKFLIQLSTKSKVNLMENFKRSTSRDFRINTAALEQALNEHLGSDDEQENDREKENTTIEAQHIEPGQEAKTSKANSKRSNTRKGDHSSAKKLKV